MSLQQTSRLFFRGDPGLTKVETEAPDLVHCPMWHAWHVQYHICSVLEFGAVSLEEEFEAEEGCGAH